MLLRHKLNISCNSLPDTKRLAGCFASYLTPGLVVGLNGPLGVGKSAFARFVIQAACGAPCDVPSPTFTLVQTYESAQGIDILHMDLYRLEAPEDVLALGVEDSFIEAANLVEWPMKMGHYWPQNAIDITLDFAKGDERHVTITATQAFCEALCEALDACGIAAQITA